MRERLPAGAVNSSDTFAWSTRSTLPAPSTLPSPSVIDTGEGVTTGVPSTETE